MDNISASTLIALLALSVIIIMMAYSALPRISEANAFFICMGIIMCCSALFLYIDNKSKT